jgi:hypothetical protein
LELALPDEEKGKQAEGFFVSFELKKLTVGVGSPRPRPHQKKNLEIEVDTNFAFGDLLTYTPSSK